ncbi:MAG: lipid-A-disaccharide synthase [Gammaproteobacteria bacterium]|nr:MAG: lipid-A-disaccharide synthase [Gammaproteobacteria bacterium]
MHIALLAGEPSGDQLGAELIKSLLNINPCIRFDGVGGPLMMAQGMNSLLPMEDFSVMGISEIVRRLPKLLRYRRKLFDNYQAVMPNAFVGIDYPEFNLSLEKKLKEIGIYTVHYVSPSVWAWREKRIHHIKASCDLMLTLFDFEKRFYQRHNMPVVHCGTPLTDIISETPDPLLARQRLTLEKDAIYLAILPGSRVSEVEKMLPVFMAVAERVHRQLPEVKCVIPAATATLANLIEQRLGHLANHLSCQIILGQGKKVIEASDAVLLASGTAALEAMLLQKPMLVSYKVSGLTALLAKRLVKIAHFSLPNLLANHPIVPEYIQDDIDPDKMANELINLLTPSQQRHDMLREFVQLRKQLPKHGADIAARAIYDGLIHKGLMGLES